MVGRNILIVEDELFIALDLELLVTKHAPTAEIVICASVDEAASALVKPYELALLDIDVIGGKTFQIAKALKDRGIPFVFISGSERENVPPELADAPFLPKPLAAPMIQTKLREVFPDGHAAL